jgi:hypothetical protein
VIDPWHDSDYELKYQLGDCTLAKKIFAVHQCQIGVRGDTDVIDLPTLEDTKYQGLSVRGLPVSKVGKIFTRDSKFYIYNTVQSRRYYLDLTGSFDEYLSRFRGKTRSTLRRKVKKYEQHTGGQTTFRVYRTVDELLEFHKLARRVSSKTYQENMLESGLPDDECFIKNMKALANEDRARGFLLFNGDRPVSYLYVSSVGEILIYQYLGYDPEYIKLSAGTVLHWHAIEYLFSERKYRILDFTEGEGAQKKQFSTGSILCTDRLYLRRKLSNSVFILCHIAINHLSLGIGQVLARCGVKSRIRKILRFGFNYANSEKRQPQ